ncbi:mannose-P-dolichol utilization defect 1 protein [Dendrothele bispora CBS 962.96]|uniref:Mannose-P-dolichol utilization defect 1 protein homolog n=1 Tax=Dendrothele bispora (strain CBS 962.96) TaxID=1314807 RepID=A0A4S8MHA1_DENBC|nr:mannose-P-dolichol utilization defect 1 protein [Dendrothele bispora CBS 962.96]
MTAITQNLPWFIRDLGISIIGQKCYTSLIENLDISDVECIKFSISKGLGIGIVAGGSIMKVPQLLLIVNARSAQGLSLSAYILETLSYGITLAYSYRSGFPFSTYGENFFLTLQNIIITILIIAYSQSSSKATTLPLTVLGLSASAVSLYAAPQSTLALLQIATLPLSLSSKIPQIMENARAKSTGQLSTFAVVSQIVGCIARLYTTLMEVGDPIVSAGFLLALLLNGVLGFQVWAYWGKGKVADVAKKVEKKIEEKVEPVQANSATPVAEKVSAYEPGLSQAQATRRVGTPPPGNRKWARRVD